MIQSMGGPDQSVVGLLGDLTLREIDGGHSGCRLCWAISSDGQRFASNTLLRSWPNFQLIPGLGGPCVGYVLLVSRTHRKSVALLEESELEDLQRVVDDLSHDLKKIAPNWCWFEHGSAVTAANGSGRTVDHLHLHFFPAKHDLTKDVASRLSAPPHAIASLREVPTITEGSDNYILTANSDGRMSIVLPQGYPSQFVRQIMASLEGHPESWDWRTDPLEDNCVATANRFRDAGISKHRIYFAHAIEGRSRISVEQEIARAKEALARRTDRAELVSMFELLEEPQARLDSLMEEPHADRVLVASERDLLRVSDALLADVSLEGHQYVGTLMEIAFAAEQGLPVVSLVGQSSIANRRWLRAHSDSTACNLNEAIAKVHSLICPQSSP